MLRRFLAAIAALWMFSAPAHAAQICSWLVESDGPGHSRDLDLWLQSDTNLTFVYSIYGKGIVSRVGEANAPANGSYSLRPGAAEKLWHYGATFYPPGKIDLTLEIRKVATDYFSAAPTPVLASFAFARRIPESETTPSSVLSKKQCIEIVDG